MAEATVALACAQKDIGLAVQAKREIGKLWEDIGKARYRALFNASVPGVRVWRFVPLLRAVEEELVAQRLHKDGRERMFTVHGNRFIAQQAFKRLPLDGLDDPGFDVASLSKDAKGLTVVVLEELIKWTKKLYAESYLAALFKNLNKCRTLDESLKKKFDSGQRLHLSSANHHVCLGGRTHLYVHVLQRARPAERSIWRY